MLEEIAQRNDFYKEVRGFACDEIAEDLYRASGGKGKIYEITSDTGWMKGMEYGEIKDYVYHHVYSDGKYIYDPRFNDIPMLESDYFEAMRKLNPDGINIK
ncbi:hypothetical protein IW492_17530 [Enterococcus sp. BWB1-3]|uniref:hypothetical protein n=1 Tax=Enterococcus sp. BWB1-3 TaxID=2787713 RepID=UPI001922918C|nr:hypothetical protein [Enterococcus sp. BWB1-3]MBL1231029.1 hypothetical protein [Enterococcus sp. BWB1-3]